MILIIEGSDLVGKTTLAKRIAKLNSWPIIKTRWSLRGNPEIETRAMADSTLRILHATRPDVIFDRIYFSWWAYGAALGHEVWYMPELIEDFGGIVDARLILLTATEAEIRQRYERDPQHLFSLRTILKANERFPSLLPLLPHRLPYLHIDTTSNSADDVFEQVKATMPEVIHA